MKHLITIILLITVTGCATKAGVPDGQSLADTVIQFKKFRETNPFSERLNPGAILLVSEDRKSYDILDYGEWLIEHGEGMRPESIQEKMKRDCGDDGMCKGPTKTITMGAGWTASLNLSFSENNYLKATGTNLRRAEKAIGFYSRFKAKKGSGESAFYRFKNQHKQKYEALKKSILDGIGPRQGIVAIVSEAEFVYIGNYKLTFNKNITGEAKAQITEEIKVNVGGKEAPLQYIWNDATLTISASLQSPIMNAWKVSPIEL